MDELCVRNFKTFAAGVKDDGSLYRDIQQQANLS